MRAFTTICGEGMSFLKYRVNHSVGFASFNKYRVNHSVGFASFNKYRVNYSVGFASFNKCRVNHSVDFASTLTTLIFSYILFRKYKLCIVLIYVSSICINNEFPTYSVRVTWIRNFKINIVQLRLLKRPLNKKPFLEKSWSIKGFDFNSGNFRKISTLVYRPCAKFLHEHYVWN